MEPDNRIEHQKYVSSLSHCQPPLCSEALLPKKAETQLHNRSPIPRSRHHTHCLLEAMDRDVCTMAPRERERS